MPSFRTDLNNNPTAMTTDIANEGGLLLGPDYDKGQPFIVHLSNIPKTYYTADIVLGDPIPRTIAVIDKIGFYTKFGSQRWTYIAIPKFIWDSLTVAQKTDVIGFMYQREGGTELKSYFPNYGKE